MIGCSLGVAYLPRTASSTWRHHVTELENLVIQYVPEREILHSAVDPPVQGSQNLQLDHLQPQERTNFGVLQFGLRDFFSHEGVILSK